MDRKEFERIKMDPLVWEGYTGEKEGIYRNPFKKGYRFSWCIPEEDFEEEYPIRNELLMPL
ncbi:MAG: hypothetical protein QW286_01270 [Candidatus Aenigmatarchaeota archaeon]